MRVTITVFLTLMVLLGTHCKSSKNSTTAETAQKPDTLRLKVAYSVDSIDVVRQKVIVNDALYSEQGNTVDYSIQTISQEGNNLVVTISSFTGCKKMEFELYQHSIVLKTYPPRFRFRLAKTSEAGCDVQKPAMYTAVFDISHILKDYPEAHLLFSGQTAVATVKRQEN